MSDPCTAHGDSEDSVPTTASRSPQLSHAPSSTGNDRDMCAATMHNAARRFVLFPLRSHAIWACYKDAEHQFWFAENLPVNHDDMPVSECPRLVRALAALASFMCPTSTLYACTSRLCAAIALPEARSFLGIQLAQMTICAESTETLTTFLCIDDDVRSTLFETAMNSDAVVRRNTCLSMFLQNPNLKLADLLLVWVLWRAVSAASLWPLLLHTPSFPEGQAFRVWADLAIKDISLCVRFASVVIRELRLAVDQDFCRVLAIVLDNIENCAIADLEGSLIARSDLTRYSQRAINSVFRRCGLGAVFASPRKAGWGEEYIDALGSGMWPW